MILNRFYTNEYMFKQDKRLENTLGPILHRKEEEITDNDIFKELLKLYHIMDINKLFGMSFVEYLNLNSFTRDIINDTAREIQEKIAKEMNNVEEEIEKLKGGLTPYGE